MFRDVSLEASKIQSLLVGRRMDLALLLALEFGFSMATFFLEERIEPMQGH